MMYYVIGGTMDAARWYVRHNLRTVDHRMIREMSTGTVARSGSLRGVQLHKDDEVIRYAWHLGTPRECGITEDELTVLEATRER